MATAAPAWSPGVASAAIRGAISHWARAVAAIARPAQATSRVVVFMGLGSRFARRLEIAIADLGGKRKNGRLGLPLSFQASFPGPIVTARTPPPQPPSTDLTVM